MPNGKIDIGPGPISTGMRGRNQIRQARKIGIRLPALSISGEIKMNWNKKIILGMLSFLTAAAAATLSAQESAPKPPPNVENLLTGGEWKAPWGNWSQEPDGVLALSNWVQLQYSRPIEVEPGYRYYFAARARIENFHFLQNHHYGFGFGLEQLRSGGDRNGNWYEMYTYGMYREGDAPWAEAGASWVPKDTTATLVPSVLVKADDGSKAWLSDLVVWKEPLPEKVAHKLSNVLENPSFEIIYSVDTTPFGYWLYNPAGERIEFGTVATATRERSALQASSLKLAAPCRVLSPQAKLEGDTLVASLQLLPQQLSGGKVEVRANFFDAEGKALASQPVGTIDRSGDEWETVEQTIDLRTLPESTATAQLEFALTGAGEGAVCYVDDLRLLVRRPLEGLPVRPYRTEQAQVRFDASKRGKEFISPLDAYDHHCADRIDSYSIGTAGPHLEGPGRWFELRRELGIKYVRIHNGFDQNSLNEHLPVSAVEDPDRYFGWNDGETGVTFTASRIDPATGKPFPPIVRIDENGEMITDFSGVRHYLDNSILKGGCRPIFGLEPVPMALANDNDTHQPPRDMKQWEEFVARFFTFLVETYGADEIRQWRFETGNEPSTEWTFHGRGDRSNVLADFLEMQDYIIAGAQRVLPDVYIAGPSGPPGHFFMPLLKHAAGGANPATGGTGCKLDAISYHGYMGGTPVDLSWRSSEEQVFTMMRYADYFEQLTGKALEVWNTEFAPIYLENTPKNPPNGAYDNHIQAVATLHMTNFSWRAGVTRLVFFYHSPTYFAPVRGNHGFTHSDNQATTPEFVGEPTVRTFHGVAKPVTRIFQMLSWMNGGSVMETDADVEPIFTLGTAEGDTVKLVVYSFDLDPTREYVTRVNVTGTGLKPDTRYAVTRYELNSQKANSWYLATRDKVTQQMCEEDIGVVDRLNRESEFVPEELEFSSDAAGTLQFSVPVPSMSASLFVLKPQSRTEN